jgi:predicted amidohydrolase
MKLLETRPEHVLKEYFTILYPGSLPIYDMEEEACVSALIIDMDQAAYRSKYSSPTLFAGLIGLFDYLINDQPWDKGHYLIALLSLAGLRDENTRKRLQGLAERGGRMFFLSFGNKSELEELIQLVNTTFGVFLKDLCEADDSDVEYFDIDDRVALALIRNVSEYYPNPVLGRQSCKFIAHGSWLRDFLSVCDIPSFQTSFAVISETSRCRIEVKVENTSKVKALNVCCELRIRNRRAERHVSVEYKTIVRKCIPILRSGGSFTFNFPLLERVSHNRLQLRVLFSDIEGRRFSHFPRGHMVRFATAMDTTPSETLETPDWFRRFEMELAVKVVDFGNSEVKNPCLAIVQPSIEHDFYTNCKFKEEYVEIQAERVIRLLKSAIDRGANIVLFPELGIPEKALPKMSELAGKDVYVVAGFEYDKSQRNLARIVTNGRSIYRQAKMSKSPYDCSAMKPEKKLFIFRRTGFGDFAVLICYDFSNRHALEVLEGNVDLILVPSRNKAVGTFHTAAIHNCYQNYCYVAIANVANWGGSGCYSPKKGNRALERIETPVESIVFCKLDILGLRDAISNPEKRGDFLYIPAGYKVDRVRVRQSMTP